MKTYTTLRNLYGIYTKNSSSTNLTLGDTLINDGFRFVMAKDNWSFLEKQGTLDMVASQQYYKLPADCLKPKKFTVLNGQIRYTPSEVASETDWDRLNKITNIQSNITRFWYLRGATQGGREVGLYPTPSTNLTAGIEYTYKKTVKDIAIADYTTGTIVSIASSGTAVVGSGTSWNASMIGHFIKIDETATVNGGDGLWYEISAVGSATTLTLVNPYLGSAISAGSAVYTIGSASPLPEEFQIIPVYYAVYQYWLTIGNDKKLANNYKMLFDAGMLDMLESYGNKTTNPVISESVFQPVNLNPNNYPTA